MEENIITNSEYAPARTPDPQRLKQVEVARIKIGAGPGAEDGQLPPNKTICIMEATAYILGYTEINDSPPCTSGIIRDLLIKANDENASDRRRAQLKKLIPDIINTAPTGWRQKSKTNPLFTLRTLYDDCKYKEAEAQRREIFEKFKKSNLTKDEYDKDDYDDDEFIVSKIPMKKIIEIVRQMAAVAKFDKANEETEINGPQVTT